MSIGFDIITIFPHIFDSYLNESILKRAQQKKLIDIRVHDLRKFTKDKHKKVDDKAYGGGPGMVLKIEPLAKSLEAILRRIRNYESGIRETIIVLFTPSGKQFDNKMATSYAKKYKRIIMIAGHYEGIDDRVKSIIHNSKFKIQELSVGPYVLTGGELPAMILIDAVSRHIPGVLSKHESLEEKRYGIGIPAYTRPEEFKWHDKRYKVPKVLLSGNHKKIEEWRKKYKKKENL